MRVLGKEVITGAGHGVEAAWSLNTALEKIGPNNDGLILDHNLGYGEPNGDDVAKWALGQGYKPDQIVFVTSTPGDVQTPRAKVFGKHPNGITEALNWFFKK